jgi:glutamine synthetase
MGRTQLLPAALEYLGDLASTNIEDSRALDRTIGQVAAAADTLSDALEELSVQNQELGGDSVHEKSHHMRDNVLPAMTHVRAAADALERLIPSKLWPIPGYREMLFVK